MRIKDTICGILSTVPNTWQFLIIWHETSLVHIVLVVLNNERILSLTYLRIMHIKSINSIEIPCNYLADILFGRKHHLLVL